MKVGNNLLDTNAWTGVKKVCSLKFVLLSILILCFELSWVREEDRYKPYFFHIPSLPKKKLRRVIV